MMMKYIWIFLFLGACAGNLTEDEQFRKDWNEQVDLRNWRLCEQAYMQAGKPTWHKDHTHSMGLGKGRLRNEDVRSDLMTNRCRGVLKPAGYWEEYL
jgi:hypothetical protein